MIDTIIKLVKLPIVRFVFAILLIALVVVWRKMGSVEEKSELKADKDIVRHDNIIAKRDSIIFLKDRDCDAKLAAKDAELREKDQQMNEFLQRMLSDKIEVSRGVKKAKKEVDKAITNVTHLQNDSQPKQQE